MAGMWEMNETLPDWTLPSAKAPPPTPMRGTPRTMAYARSQSSPVRCAWVAHGFLQVGILTG